MKKISLLLTVICMTVFHVHAQQTSATQYNVLNADGGTNSDPTYFFRDDATQDRTRLKLNMGDEYTSDFEIGYNFYQDGKWYTNFSLTGSGNGLFRGSLKVNESFTSKRWNILNADGGTNSDPTYFFRDDATQDRTRLKLNMGDEYTSDFEIGYNFYQDGKWYRTFSVDGRGNGFFRGQLSVNGLIQAEEIRVVVDVPADYVFEEEYQLKPLSEVEGFINENGHLPNMPSADEIKAQGWEVGKMNNKLLEKVEELTLYMIELKKEVNDLRNENTLLKEKVLVLENN